MTKVKKTTQQKAGKKKGETKSLQAFLQDSNKPQTSSWADEMDDDYVDAPIETSANDLRATIDAASTSSYPTRSQFEHGAEDRASSWSRGPDMDREPAPRQQQQHFSSSSSSSVREHLLPNEPPFILFIKNLPFDATRDDVGMFFEESGDIRIENIILPQDRERPGRIRGHGYVEFVDFESTKAALSHNGRQFMGRNITVDVTDTETAQRMATRSGEGGFSGSFGRRRQNREDQPQTIADQADNWRGGGGDMPDIFGKRRQPRQENAGFEASFQRRRPREDREDRGDRPPREDRVSFEDQFALQKQKRGQRFNESERREDRPRRERPPRTERRSEEPLDENDPLLAATSSQSERPKLNLKDRTIEEPVAAKTKSGGIFGEGKAWEETDELRQRVEKLAVETKPQVPVATEEKKPVEREEKKSDRKNMDFSNFTTKRNQDKGSRGALSARGGPSSRGRGYNNKRDATVGDKPEKRQESTTTSSKKQEKPAVENVWSALEQVDE